MGIYGREILDTLHERVGEEEQIRGNPALADSRKWTNGAWGRAIVHNGKARGEPLTLFPDSGPSYDVDMFAFQWGLDVYRHQDVREDGSIGDRDHAGLIVTWGNVDADVDHNLLGFRFPAGKIAIDNYSLGAFWTHFEPDGAYLDLVGHVTKSDISIRSFRMSEIKTDGWSIALSAEGGYPFVLDENWRLEPQAQFIYQGFDIDGFNDGGAQIRFRDLDSLVGRVGLRLAHNGDLQGWLRGNIWHEFLGDAKAEFSSADGYVPFRANPDDTWWQIGVGTNMLVRPNLTLFGQGNYESSFDGDAHAWEGKFGFRINWR